MADLGRRSPGQATSSVEDDPAANAGAPPDADQRLERRCRRRARTRPPRPRSRRCRSRRALLRGPSGRPPSGRGDFQSGRLPASATMPLRGSTAPGAPTPTPFSSVVSTPAAAAASCNVSASAAMTASGPPLVGVGWRAWPKTSGPPSMTTAWILVPPRSIPAFITLRQTLSRKNAPMPVIGVDVGGTKIAAAVVGDAGADRVVERPTDTSSGQAVLDGIDAAVAEVRDAIEVDAVGVGMPSQIEFATGTVVSSVNIPLEGVAVRDELSGRLGAPVFVDNDANCAALAEATPGRLPPPGDAHTGHGRGRRGGDRRKDLPRRAGPGRGARARGDPRRGAATAPGAAPTGAASRPTAPARRWSATPPSWVRTSPTRSWARPSPSTAT